MSIEKLEAIEREIGLRFVSGNHVPVTRATITREEFDSLAAIIKEWRAQEPAAYIAEIAHSFNGKTDEYFDWREVLTRHSFSVPEKGVRNVRPLYAYPPVHKKD